MKMTTAIHRLPLMFKFLIIFFLLLLFFFTFHIGRGCRASPNRLLTLEMEVSHRFSVKVQGMFLSYGIRVDSGLNKGGQAQMIPNMGALNEEEYSRMKYLYRFLHIQDRRRLTGNDDTQKVLMFSSGNETKDYGGVFGWLHYTMIDVGSPNASFLVALDTGSDQLWIPCQCQQCASTSEVSQLLKFPLQTYNPSTSNTSKHITCGSSLCYTSNSTCPKESDDCEYTINYLSDNTSSSGILVEDVIHLASGTTITNGKSIEFPFVFGCAQNQTGDFLSGGAPNGLLGLGFGETSLPSSLARSGLIRDSFSMCFQGDGSGRIFFGATELSSQQTTSLLSLNLTHLPYVVSLDKITVGDKLLEQLSVKIIVDTGTSFTYLPTEVYSAVTSEFDQQVQLERFDNTDIPLEYCYKLSPDLDANALVVPAISMVFQGGGNFSVVSPFVGIANEAGTALDGFCLGILESNISILGQNFMIGYQLVFNRQDMKLGWSPSDCYKVKENEVSAPSPYASVQPPGASASSPSPPSNAPSSIPPVVGSSHIHAPSLNIILIFSLVLINSNAYMSTI